MMQDDIAAMMEQAGHGARRAAQVLACAGAQQKQQALEQAADALWDMRADIMAANAQDLDYARAKGLSDAMMDRLMLDEGRIGAIAQAMRDIAAQPDPVGQVLADWQQPSGIHIQRISVPLGVIGVIYESRPNVTADAAALCLKAGNAVILRGGSESLHSSKAIHRAVQAGLAAAGLPPDAVQYLATRDRAMVQAMVQAVGLIDVIIPRGGKGLVGLIQREARVPVLAHLEGICHVYIDGQADLEKARRVLLNAKTRRTGICGAAECVLIDRAFYQKHGDIVLRDLLDAGVEVRADGALAQVAGTVPAQETDFGHEFLDMIIAAKLVDGVQGAMAHIARYGSQHTEAILTEDQAIADMFLAQVDAAIVLHNASTQFADGGEFGMGAEIGIATGKLHARGPIGAAQLTGFKYIVRGNGACRA